MKNVILYLENDMIRARGFEEQVIVFEFSGKKFIAENSYFGDWIALTDKAKRIVGVKLAPFVSNTYLSEKFFPTDFATRAKNISIENGKHTYITILLENAKDYAEESKNRIEAAILRSSTNDVVFRLDGFTPKEIQSFRLS